MALEICAGILFLLLPLKLIDDKLRDRCLLVRPPWRRDLAEDALFALRFFPSVLPLRDRLVTVPRFLDFSFGRAVLSSEELFDRRAFLAARLRPLDLLDVLLTLRDRLTPCFFIRLPPEGVLEELRRLLVAMCERPLARSDETLIDRRSPLAVLL